MDTLRLSPAHLSRSASAPSSSPTTKVDAIAHWQAASMNHRPASHAPTRSYTNIRPSSLKVKKRIIVCCDGTWQDGVIISERWKYTNVLRLSRAIHHVDERFIPPVPQIVFYQSGVGTDSRRYQAILDGAVGAGLGDKVQEAYAFIAHNYEPGDDIFLFGFSRGAYTARMIAAMIKEIGVLDRTDMDHFAEIFVNLQARGKSKSKDKIASLDAKLAPWTRHDSPGKVRADYDGDSFSVKCVGVFDTVGALGLPEELALGSKKIHTLFGFSDSLLGDHIERAYQALALNETRTDFNCNKFELSEEGKRKKQILKQCWFAGCHSDIGGGYKEHDLADITLFWMAANIEDIISIDMKYIFSLLQPNAPWGTQKPHDPRTGVFTLADATQRQFPRSLDPNTHERIHPSVLMQSTLVPQLADTLTAHPDLISQLMPLEHQLKQQWPHILDESRRSADIMETKPATGMTFATGVTAVRHRSFVQRVLKSLKKWRGRGTVQCQSTGMPVKRVHSTPSLSTDERSWLSKVMQETSFGAFLRD